MKIQCNTIFQLSFKICFIERCLSFIFSQFKLQDLSYATPLLLIHAAGCWKTFDIYIYYFNINIYSDVCTYIWWWILGLSFWRCWQMTATAVASSARRARWSRRYVKIRIRRSLCQSMSYHLRPISLVFFKKQLIKILSIKVMTKCLEGVPALFDVSEVNSYVICLWITLWAFDCNRNLTVLISDHCIEQW